MKTEKTLQLKPKHFKNHVFSREFESYYTEEQIWQWLNDPKTFTDHQIWPFRVEFLKDASQEHEFEPGVLNTHHGPLLSLAGEIGEVNAHYRDLKYYYGSYVFSFRFIRPYRLEFFTEDIKDKRIVTVQLSSFVKPSFYKLWGWMQGLFWANFGKWMNKSIKKRLK